MQFIIQCACGKYLDANAQKPGDRAQCPACGNVFAIGEPVTTTTAIQAETPRSRMTPRLPTELPQPIEGQNERTLVERFLIFGVIASVVLILILSVGYLSVGQLGPTLADIAATTIKGPLTSACKAFELKNGRWPASLDELLHQNEKGGPFLEDRHCLIDPWGNRYQYDIKGPMNNGVRPDIWTVAPRTGAKIGNWPTR